MGEGGKPISDFGLTRGGGVVWTPPFFAYIICEQPLMNTVQCEGCSLLLAKDEDLAVETG